MATKSARRRPGSGISHFTSWRSKRSKKAEVLAGDHHELPAAAKESITPLRLAAEGVVSA
jgi:hypothetical protein